MIIFKAIQYNIHSVANSFRPKSLKFQSLVYLYLFKFAPLLINIASQVEDDLKLPAWLAVVELN